jgi:hypothetical protein
MNIKFRKVKLNANGRKIKGLKDMRYIEEKPEVIIPTEVMDYMTNALLNRIKESRND